MSGHFRFRHDHNREAVGSGLQNKIGKVKMDTVYLYFGNSYGVHFYFTCLQCCPATQFGPFFYFFIN